MIPVPLLQAEVEDLRYCQTWRGPARSTPPSRPCSDSTVAPRPRRRGSPAKGAGEGALRLAGVAAVCGGGRGDEGARAPFRHPVPLPSSSVHLLPSHIEPSRAFVPRPDSPKSLHQFQISSTATSLTLHATPKRLPIAGHGLQGRGMKVHDPLVPPPPEASPAHQPLLSGHPPLELTLETEHR
ncbi:hypothetical protein C2845_PM07G19110 [Panicum miliaceum]|uniref:Uncharacterized protein n=1 Tax=Panicum miliaceum TaxID=4540 RepID=A0A3L6SM88_PANMI|nr:hypothetical protein C2845_PM07G19110 [Panicum miliaceum]